MQPLTGPIVLGGDPFLEEHITRIARVFRVVRQAAQLLRQRYANIIASPNTLQNSRFLPSPRSLSPEDSAILGRLKFTRRFLDNDSEMVSHDLRRSIYHATLDGKPVFVKFCERYGDKAHRLLAQHGLAPTLHLYTVLQGGVRMVVMDSVNGQDASTKFGSTAKLPVDVRSDLTRALRLLHDANLVFGDLRRPNIMIPTEDGQLEGEKPPRAMLVDFDWSGKAGEATYPTSINGTLRWADGVRGAGNIEIAHDEEMLRRLDPDDIV